MSEEELYEAIVKFAASEFGTISDERIEGIRYCESDPKYDQDIYDVNVGDTFPITGEPVEAILHNKSTIFILSVRQHVVLQRVFQFSLETTRCEKYSTSIELFTNIPCVRRRYALSADWVTLSVVSPSLSSHRLDTLGRDLRASAD